MPKTEAQLQREIDRARAGDRDPRHVVKILSGQLSNFVEDLRGSRRNTYLSSLDCDGVPCLEIGLDEEVARPLALLQDIARRAHCLIEISVKAACI
jgi:hypothetical protein